VVVILEKVTGLQIQAATLAVVELVQKCRISLPTNQLALVEVVERLKLEQLVQLVELVS